jgi:hypothetical protein
MTDWISQTQAIVEQWLRAQREWWEAMTGRPPDEPAAGDFPRLAVDAWRRSAHAIVDAQAELLLAALRTERRGDAEALVRAWTDAQREMWQGWLAVAGRGERAGEQAAGDVAEAGRHMVDAMREAAEQLVRSQAQWAQAWTRAQQGGKPPEPPPPPPEPPPAA